MLGPALLIFLLIPLSHPIVGHQFISSLLDNEENVNIDINIGDDDLLKLGNHCRPQYPEVILYNRVAKCGSTTTLQYLIQNSRYEGRKIFNWTYYKSVQERSKHPNKNPFVMYPDTEERNFRTGQMLAEKPYILATHTVWYPYLKPNTMQSVDGKGIISYFNIVREPYDRNISLWNFIGKPCYNQSFCADYKSEMMGAKVPNPIIRYFCGFQPECLQNNEISLYIAKVRAVMTYSFVGITERMNETISMLRRHYPSFFHTNYDGHLYNTHSHRDKAFSDDRDRFNSYNRLDILFYQFIVKLFDIKLLACQI